MNYLKQLQDLGIVLKRQSGSTKTKCPKCSHTRRNKTDDCLSVNIDEGLYNCHHCGWQGNVLFKQKQEYIIPEKVKVNLTDRVIKWFAERSITEPTLVHWKIGESFEYMPQVRAKRKCINFNYYRNDSIVNVKYRDGRKNFKLYKGAEKIFYNIDNIVGYEYCVIVEGEIDALSLYEAGIPNTISVPNGATLNSNNLDYLDNCIDYFTDKEKIIIAVDQDEPGVALQSELIRRLGAEVCYVADFDDCKDANEYLLKHGREKLVQCITKAKPVPLENVTTLKDIEGEITDFVENGFKKGFQIGLENFDEIFSTYTGQFITVTGIPSSGKSDFVDQMVIGYNANYGWKTAFASPENAPTFLHAHKLMRKVWQDMPRKSDIGGDKWRSIAGHVNDNFFFIDMERYTLESVLKKGAELVKRKGIKCLVIDPFNKIRDVDAKTEDVNRYTMEYLTKIEIFAKKYDVLVIIVAHPTKMYKDGNGKIEEPTMYNIKGGGEWYDASYHGLLVHRDYENKTVKAKVLKVKFQNLGENGAEAYFKWEPKSGCFIPHYETVTDDKMPWEAD